MPRPIITLLTDFGLRDTYVGQMKGTLLAQCPDAVLVDLTHEIPPQSVLSGALHLGAAWASFPEQTVHLAVVDPGVGTTRRQLVIHYRGHYFVLPDNGLISAVLEGAVPNRVVEIRVEPAQRSTVSSTFHGRDVFAPAAGRIAAGWSLDDLGEPVDVASIRRLDLPCAWRDGDVIGGEIILIDGFGNCITNIQRSMLPECGSATVRFGDLTLERISTTYQDVAAGMPLALISSMNTLELAVRDGSAADRFNLSVGVGVEVVIEQSKREPEWNPRLVD